MIEGVDLADYDYTGKHLDKRTVHAPDNQIIYDVGFDEHRRLDQIVNRRDGTGGPMTLASFEYTFGGVGNRISTTGGGNPVHLGNIGYVYDELHRLRASRCDDGTENFNYDLLGNRKGDCGATEECGYIDTRPPGRDISYAGNNPANEYTEIDFVPLEYDHAGNLTSDEAGLGYAYDFEGRLVCVFDDADGDGKQDHPAELAYASYAWDALGRRVASADRRSGSPVYRYYYYDGQNVIAEFDTGGPLKRCFVNGPTYIDERIAVYDADTDAEYYYLLKELYTVAGLADAAGEIVELYDYDNYGAVKTYVPDQALAGKGDYDQDSDVDLIDFIRFQTCFTGDGGGLGEPDSGCEVFDFDTDDDVDLTDLQAFWTCFAGPGARGGAMTPSALSVSMLNPYCFTGRRLDFIDTGNRQLYHYRARTYDPLHGRFNQRDPAGYVDGMNLYEYVGSTPLGTTDPLGLFDWEKFKQAWKIYSGLDDDGAAYARKLMKHYVFGSGKHFKHGFYYEHRLKTSWWSGARSWTHRWYRQTNATAQDKKWAEFMKGRPELQNTARTFYNQKTSRLCNMYKGLSAQGFVSDARQFDWNAAHTRLNRLKSMRLTLHGSERIQVTGFHVVSYDTKCECTVEYGWVTWYWHDHGDLLGNTATELDTPQDVVKDSDFKKIGIGQSYQITISWTDEKAVWHSKRMQGSNRYDKGKHVSGWP